MSDGAPLESSNHKGSAVTLRRAILGALVCVLLSNSQSTLVAKELLTYRGTVLSGIVAAELATSTDQCRALCEGRDGCVGFDHNAASNRCRLFSSVASAQDNSSYTAATRQAIAGYGEPMPSLIEYPDVALSGRETAKLKDTDQDRCRQLCDERSGCAGFEHDALANTCRMFSEVTSARDSRGSLAATRKEVAGFRPPTKLRTAPDPQPSQSRWLHNGSVMTLHQRPTADGTSEVEIVYDIPKGHLLKTGIRSGSTLFRGTLSDGFLTGKSRLTSSRCGIIEYDVQGPFDSRSSVPLYLRGGAPKRGQDCSVESWSEAGANANLRFDPQ